MQHIFLFPQIIATYDQNIQFFKLCFQLFFIFQQSVSFLVAQPGFSPGNLFVDHHKRESGGKIKKKLAILKSSRVTFLNRKIFYYQPMHLRQSAQTKLNQLMLKKFELAVRLE